MAHTAVCERSVYPTCRCACSGTAPGGKVSAEPPVSGALATQSRGLLRRRAKAVGTAEAHPAVRTCAAALVEEPATDGITGSLRQAALGLLA